ncbi:MAG TPA: hypothetical protein VM389_03280, partial [Phycisphaerae bacterium]|nr:hypothetical protein [Phycisphaerae bacterium]
MAEASSKHPMEPRLADRAVPIPVVAAILVMALAIAGAEDNPGVRTTPATAPADTYERAFLDLYLALGRQYPCFQLKGIDWRAVGGAMLPRVKEVKTDEQFGLLCMELIARLEDSHALLGSGTAAPPAPPLPRWDPGLACLIDDRGRPVVYFVDKGGPAGEAGVKVGETIVSINDTEAGAAIRETMKLLSRYCGYSSDRYLQYHAARFFLRQMDRGAKVRLVLAGPGPDETRRVELPATLGVRYLPRLPVPIKGVGDSGNVSWTMLEGNVGYIYVRRIQPDLIASLDKAIGALQGARGLIVDVRGNSGGGFDGSRAFRNFDADDKAEPDRPR